MRVVGSSRRLESAAAPHGRAHRPPLHHAACRGDHLTADACWGRLRLDIGEGESRIVFVRVAYDVEAAARGVVDAGLPKEFAEFLRTGGQPTARVVV